LGRRSARRNLELRAWVAWICGVGGAASSWRGIKECFSAARGEGAFLNRQKLKTSGCTELEKAMLAASFSPNVPRGSEEVARFVELLHTARALRRLGSAALNLCYVAAGRLDGYWATSVKIWDVAAGLLVIEEAGGVATDLFGERLRLQDPKLVVSASPQLQTDLLTALDRAIAPTQKMG
jgi:myo-inositol-1(or 4)-monophosphatase